MWQLRNLIARPTLRRSFEAVRELGLGSEENITLFVELTDGQDSGPCECCGDVTKTVWGFVGTDSATLAAYYVQWVPGNTAGVHAMFDLLVGRWGEGASRFQRTAVAVEYRVTEEGPGFMIQDAHRRSVSHRSLVAARATRNQIVGTDRSGIVFALIDAIWEQDPRIRELVETAS